MNTQMEITLNHLQNIIMEKFVSHPRSVCMDYISHFGFAMYMAKLHAYGVYVSVVHAFFPWIYPSAVTELNVLIKEKIEQNGCRKKQEESSEEESSEEESSQEEPQSSKKED